MYIIYANIHDGSAMVFQMVNGVREFDHVFNSVFEMNDWMKKARNIILYDSNSETYHTEDRIK
jgi:hypothetical protein